MIKNESTLIAVDVDTVKWSRAQRWHFFWGGIALLLSFASTPCLSAGAESGDGRNTVLGIKGSRFTLNDKATFLLGFSYYGALGAPEDFIRKDLADFRSAGFNWLRVWATWGGYDT